MKLNAKSRIVFGLTGLLTSVILLASFLGLIHDDKQAVREGRAAIAEIIAANSSIQISQNDIKRLYSNLTVAVNRSDDLMSAALRANDGQLVAEIGQHESSWIRRIDNRSTESQIMVPIWEGSSSWGYVELRFKAISREGYWAILDDSLLRLTIFIAIFSAIAFYIYLGMMLKQLDPSNAIPGRVRTALDTMAEGLLILDKKEQIVLSNSAFGKLHDKSFDELLGMPISRLPWMGAKDDSFDESTSPWRKALQSGLPELNQRIRLESSNENHLTFLINCSPVQDNKGKSSGVLVSFDDVTLLEQQEIELRNSKEIAEAANNAKSVFLAQMSHEIRTPMNAILGFTELMRRNVIKDPEERQHHLDLVYSSGNHLLSLINDILDLTKVEAGKLDLELTNFNPCQIVNEITSVLDVKAKEKGIDINMHIDGNLPTQIKSDPVRIKQIITNLLGNAIKFTDHGYVEVKLSAEKFDDHIQMAIAVMDTGIGIPAESINSIFDSFVQADSTITRRFGGTGLGLSISREFAQALGGDIKVSSELGKGSNFTVTLNVSEVQGAEWLSGHQILESVAHAQDTEFFEWQFPASSILVVDDGNENRKLVKLVLEPLGLTLTEAENGQQAIDLFTSKKRFDLVLMDIQMPVMDGFTATTKMREFGITCPIIALTGNAMKGFDQKCFAAGFSDYLSKPINIDQFIEKVATALNAIAVEKEFNQIATDSNKGIADNSVKVETSSTIYPVLPKDNDQFRELAYEFAAQLGSKLQAMHKLFTERNFTELAKMAHWLRGAGGTVGFDDLTYPAGRLESAAKTTDQETTASAMSELFSLAARMDGVILIEQKNSAHASNMTTKVPQQPDSDHRSTLEIPLVSRIADIPNMAILIDEFLDQLNDTNASMQTAWNNRDMASLSKLASWLKGSGGTMGFEDFTLPATELEKIAASDNCDEIPALLDTISILIARIQLSKGLTDS